MKNDPVYTLYSITNKANGFVYIGRTRDYKGRVTSHKILLRKNKHCNSILQSHWNIFGEDSFSYDILKTGKDISYNDELQAIVDHQLNCYNIESPVSFKNNDLPIPSFFAERTLKQEPNNQVVANEIIFCKIENAPANPVYLIGKEFRVVGFSITGNITELRLSNIDTPAKCAECENPLDKEVPYTICDDCFVDLHAEKEKAQAQS